MCWSSLILDETPTPSKFNSKTQRAVGGCVSSSSKTKLGHVLIQDFTVVLTCFDPERDNALRPLGLEACSRSEKKVKPCGWNKASRPGTEHIRHPDNARQGKLQQTHHVASCSMLLAATQAAPPGSGSRSLSLARILLKVVRASSDTWKSIPHSYGTKEKHHSFFTRSSLQ